MTEARAVAVEKIRTVFYGAGAAHLLKGDDYNDLVDDLAAFYAQAQRETWEIVEQRLQELIDAYPPEIFIEPPAGQHGETVDACSARMGRHVGVVLLRWIRRQKEKGDE